MLPTITNRPDFKGIETVIPASTQALAIITNRPDFKGIETTEQLSDLCKPQQLQTDPILRG